jgi:TolB-like protein
VKKKGQSAFVLLPILVLLAFWSCAVQPPKPTYVKDGKVYGKVRGTFRHRWWNYYERGISFAEGQFFPEAVADLKEAIQQRTKDQRMARTYGMHFIDYFPHRELGIVYYEMGSLEAAERELELSLSHFLSSKACFYLDRVRKALIQREGREVSPPELAFSFKTDELWTREDPVVISGVVEDENYVAGITIRGVPLFLEGSQKCIQFKELLELPQGPHAIEVAAKNLMGKVTRREVVIHVDRQGPIITLDELHFDAVGTGGELRIYGSIYDEAGVSSLRINGQTIPIKEAAEVPFRATLTTDADSLELQALDRLGNQTSALIPFTSGSVSHAPVMLACVDSDVGGHVVARLLGPKDTCCPSIRLTGWVDSQTVFLEKAYIEGQVSDESAIDSLMINGMPILRRKGRHIFFSHMADLREGENVLTIQAGDEAGNTASKKITIIRRIPKALQLAERMSLTALPFEQKGEVSEASLAFQDNLIDGLVNRNRFRVVERDKLDIILEEQKLSRTKLFDKRTALRLGKLAGAQCIIAGSIIETRTGIEVVARMIDTETSEILATEDVYDEVKDLLALRALAEGMAIKFHQEFPLVDGLVIERKEEDIFTDLGQDVIELRRRLIVYREEPVKHPVTGKVLGADNKIMGHARVTQVMPEMSKAELLECKAEAIRRLDKVITQ